MRRVARSPAGRRGNRQSVGEAFIKRVIRSIGSSVGRSLGQKLWRGILGSLTSKR